MLEFEEFCEVISKYIKDPALEEQEMRDALKMFDKSGDGTVSRDELKQVALIWQIK